MDKAEIILETFESEKKSRSNWLALYYQVPDTRIIGEIEIEDVGRTNIVIDTTTKQWMFRTFDFEDFQTHSSWSDIGLTDRQER